MTASTRETPANLNVIETEAALLGALVIDNPLVDRVAEVVRADDFAEPLHDRLFGLICGEVSAGRRASPVTLRPMVENDPAIVALGGPQYLAQLTGSGAALIGTMDFARQIRDYAKRRRLYGSLTQLLDRISFTPTSIADAFASEHQTVEQLVGDVDAALAEALEQAESAQSFTVVQAYDQALRSIEDEASGAALPGLALSGFEDWNTLTGPMRPGEVVILAGRPSMGKTAVALSAALAAARAGHGTLFVSLEMSVQELMKRAITDLIFRYGRSASFDDVKAGRFGAEDRTAIATARAQIAQWPMVLRQDAGLKVGRLAMMIRRYKRQMAGRDQTLKVVFVDYLGLVRADGSKVKRYEEVSEVSRTIKQIARELDVTIVLLAQLNREVEKREDKRPQLSDLRDSGEIEQDADTVLFVYREQYYLERAEPDRYDKRYEAWTVSMQAARDRVELIAAKVRNGRVGRRLCYFFGEHQAVRGSNFFTGDDR